MPGGLRTPSVPRLQSRNIWWFLPPLNRLRTFTIWSQNLKILRNKKVCSHVKNEVWQKFYLSIARKFIWLTKYTFAYAMTYQWYFWHFWKCSKSIDYLKIQTYFTITQQSAESAKNFWRTNIATHVLHKHCDNHFSFLYGGRDISKNMISTKFCGKSEKKSLTMNKYKRSPF